MKKKLSIQPLNISKEWYTGMNFSLSLSKLLSLSFEVLEGLSGKKNDSGTNMWHYIPKWPIISIFQFFSPENIDRDEMKKKRETPPKISNT